MVDVLIGGVMLSVGLAIILTITGRAVKSQTEGEYMVSAAWLIDERLGLIEMEGPDNYPQLHDMSGSFGAPYEDFSFDVAIDEEEGIGDSYRVAVTVFWPGGGTERAATVETVMAKRLGDVSTQVRMPLEPIDRIGRAFGDDAAGAGAGTGGDAGSGSGAAGGDGGSGSGGSTTGDPR
jgi:uncharacterized membrane protein YgcG